MKKEYQKPTMQVEKIAQTQIICTSPDPGAKSILNFDDFEWTDGLDDDV